MFPRSSSADSSQSSDSIPRKVCIVSASTTECHHGYSLFIVDLNSGGGGGGGGDSSDLAPTALLAGEFFQSAAFCVLGSTLYVFEGLCGGEEFEGHAGVSCRRRKCIYSYQLPSSDISNLILEESMLVKVCGMKDTKLCPSAIPTPDGRKIVVFPSGIEPFNNNRNRCDFELFDPAGGRVGKGKCDKLPQLRPWESDSIYNKICWINSVTFKAESVLLLQTGRRMFTLNLEARGRELRWEPLYHFLCGLPCEIPFELIGEDICLTSIRAYDIGNEEEPIGSYPAWSFAFPELSSFPDSEVRPQLRDATLLDVTNPRDCKFCILQTGIENTDPTHCIPHLILDVYSCDLIKCKEEFIRYRHKKKEEYKDSRERRSETFPLPGATKVTSFKFCLKPHYQDCFFIRSVCSIPPAI